MKAVYITITESGASIIAMVAKELGRECIGVEIEKKYYEEALRRVDHTPRGLF